MAAAISMMATRSVGAFSLSYSLIMCPSTRLRLSTMRSSSSLSIAEFSTALPAVSTPSVSAFCFANDRTPASTSSQDWLETTLRNREKSSCVASAGAGVASAMTWRSSSFCDAA